MLVLYAPNVHTGGGLTLLRALLAAPPATARFILDERARSALAVPQGAVVHWTAHSVQGRLQAERLLADWAQPDTTILCFHNLPPLLANAGRVVVFQQNRHLISGEALHGFPLATRLRLHAERWIGRVRRHRVSAYVVQTDSMARQLAAWWGAGTRPAIHVCPIYEPLRAPAAHQGAESWDFVYVSDGELHKNHDRLLQAWVLLAQNGLRPSLALTLGPRHAGLAARVEAAAREQGLHVRNLGALSRDAVGSLYASSRACIFPSTAESYGLPLVEAEQAGLPILAGELDFVRDVCQPVQTFDPTSPVSIARAVRRHLGQGNLAAQTRTPQEFWMLLTSAWARD